MLIDQEQLMSVWMRMKAEAKTSRTYFFPDSNFFFHYIYFAEAPWTELLQAKQVCLVFAPAVQGELDKYKRDTKSKRRRNRAISVAKAIDKVLESGMPDTDLLFHSKLSIHILGSEPDDAYFQGLDRQIPDDRIVASTLNFKAQTSDPVVLISGDTNVRVKARARGLQVPVIPEAWHLSEEPDDLEREVDQLKQQVAALEQREPQLGLTLAAEKGTGGSLIVYRRAVREPTPQEYEQRGRVLISKQPADPVVSYIRMQNQAEESRAAVREQAKWRAYLRDVYAYEDTRSRSCDLIPTVMNNGTTAAEDVAIELIFPDDFIVGERTDLPGLPQEPERGSHSAIHLAVPAATRQAAWMSAAIRDMSFKPRDVHIIRDVGRSWYLRYEIERVVQSVPKELPPFVFTFPKAWSGTNVEVRCRLVAGNMLKACETNLTIPVNPGVTLAEPWISLDSKADV